MNLDLDFEWCKLFVQVGDVNFDYFFVCFIFGVIKLVEQVGFGDSVFVGL